jgi:hypothetical protein
MTESQIADNLIQLSASKGIAGDEIENQRQDLIKKLKGFAKGRLERTKYYRSKAHSLFAFRNQKAKA